MSYCKIISFQSNLTKVVFKCGIGNDCTITKICVTKDVFVISIRIWSNRFITIIRNKFGVKYEGVKKYTFSTSYEFFNSVALVNRLEWQNWRWTIEAERKLNKRNFISLGYLIQKDLKSSVPASDFVVLVGYKHIFKKDTD